jgi:alpha-galactosidase
MERIAKDIMALGLKPGLWLAPIAGVAPQALKIIL